MNHPEYKSHVQKKSCFLSIIKVLDGLSFDDALEILGNSFGSVWIDGLGHMYAHEDDFNKELKMALSRLEEILKEMYERKFQDL